jgi:hypothetical protein
MQPDQRRAVPAGAGVLDAELLQVGHGRGGQVRLPRAAWLIGLVFEQRQRAGLVVVSRCGREPERDGVGVGEQDFLVYQAV